MSLDTKNAFAALNVKGSKSKSSGKEGQSDKAEGKKLSKKAQHAVEREKQAALEASIFGGGGATGGVSNWADELDNEDDFETSRNGATLAPLPDDWAAEAGEAHSHSEQHHEESSDDETHLHDIHEELGIEVDDRHAAAEEEEAKEPEAVQPTAQEQEDARAAAAAEAAAAGEAQRLADQQLSKKEQKRLEMEKLKKDLEELGIQPDADGTVEEQHSAVNSAKAAKKARQKAAAAAAATAATGVDSQDSSADANGTATSTEVAAPGSGDDALTATPAEGVDPAEAKKRLAAKKKAAGAKKTSATSAAAVAAAEAKKRAAKKGKKDKANFNQMPTR